MAHDLRGRCVSTFVTGQLLDENNRPWEALRVSILDTVSLFRSPLNAEPAVSGSTGHFELAYPPDEKIGLFGHRKLEVVVKDKVGRVLLRHTVVDVDNDVSLDLDDLIIKRADGAGLRVTLMEDQTRYLSDGNALTLLIDNQMYEHTLAQFNGAQTSVSFTQLTFGLPVKFEEEPSNETPSVIFKFDPPDPTDPIQIGVGDTRPERALIAAAGRDVEVRILMHAFRLPLLARLLIGVVTFPFGFLIDEKIHDKLTGANEAQQYFEDAIEPNISVRAFPQPIVSAGVLHARLLVVDEQRATVIGGSYSQGYVDTFAHLVDEPRRGNRTGLPIHEVGFGVEGPAVAHVNEAMRLVWNEDIPADELDEIQPPAEQTQGGDAIASLQIVRTLTSGRFSKDAELADGEKGILEGYLRAIANAKDFIYLENQYFTNNAIEEALIDALNATPELQVIAVVNIEPDVWFYPWKQRRLITRIRRAVPETTNGRPRFGVFTRWTHETGSPRPRILPVYIHAKVGIVDNQWATIGSANLDGLSLDSMLIQDFLSKFGMRESRAVETNALIFNDAEHPTEAVDLLRRRLWAEQLGFGPPAGPPDAGDPRLLLSRVPANGWLQLWIDRAEEKRLALVNTPAQSQAGLGHVLPWPTENSTFQTPRKHLNALGVKTHRIVPLRGTRPFLFDEGDFEEGKSPEMDYD
jgi:PLD-like domain